MAFRPQYGGGEEVVYCIAADGSATIVGKIYKIKSLLRTCGFHADTQRKLQYSASPNLVKLKELFDAMAQNEWLVRVDPASVKVLGEFSLHPLSKTKVVISHEKREEIRILAVGVLRDTASAVQLLMSMLGKKDFSVSDLNTVQYKLARCSIKSIKNMLDNSVLHEGYVLGGYTCSLSPFGVCVYIDPDDFPFDGDEDDYDYADGETCIHCHQPSERK